MGLERKPSCNHLVSHECLQTMMSPFLTVTLYKWDSFPAALTLQPLLHQASVLPFTNLGARGTFIPLLFAWHLNSICVVYTSGTRPLHGAVPMSRAWQGERLGAAVTAWVRPWVLLPVLSPLTTYLTAFQVRPSQKMFFAQHWAPGVPAKMYSLMLVGNLQDRIPRWDVSLKSLFCTWWIRAGW